ncbi:MAG: hypothetical protein ACHQHN_09500 [Sphingobacteriales bacterium]
MKFIKIFVAALAIFGLQLSVASAASPVESPATTISANKPAPQQHKVRHIKRHHLRHRPHRLHHK